MEKDTVVFGITTCCQGRTYLNRHSSPTYSPHRHRDPPVFTHFTATIPSHPLSFRFGYPELAVRSFCSPPPHTPLITSISTSTSTSTDQASTKWTWKR
jgi:hypothetical protein